MGGSPPPREGVIVIYENTRLVVTDGKVKVHVTKADGSEVVTKIDQSTGLVTD